MADLESLLREVRERRGLLTPQNVVEEAKPQDHPLHSHFEWEDSIAAHEFRIIQARQLIRRVTVTRVTPDDMPMTVRTFHSVAGPQGRAYEPIEEIIEEPMTMRILLSQMRRDFAALKRRYAHMAQFYDMLRDELPDNDGDVAHGG
jgi:hypothetical protein